MVLAKALPIHFKFFAASYLFKFPFLGWDMWLAGYIPVDRSIRKKAYQAIQ